MGFLLPDLIPVPFPDNPTFCVGTEVEVIVRNQGQAPAGPSTTVVDFFQYGTVSMSTPALDPGEEVVLRFPIPPQAFDPDAEWQLFVDFNNDVLESNELNNTVTGRCTGGV